MAEHNLFGKEAEKRALDYLTANDYNLLRKNYRFGKAEVDLLMQKEDLLIYVEIKARSSNFLVLQNNLLLQKKSVSWSEL